MNKHFTEKCGPLIDVLTDNYGRAFVGKVLSKTEFLPQVVSKQLFQPEFEEPIWKYTDRVVQENRVKTGNYMKRKWEQPLTKIETEYGVASDILIAIWGLESGFGKILGDIPTISALTSLLAKGRRTDFFSGELISVFEILSRRPSLINRLRGSWAGAMGHMQLMPSSYLTFGLDYTDKSLCEIWSHNPSDSLEIAARFLKAKGWLEGVSPMVEVLLKNNSVYHVNGLYQAKTVSKWASLGVTPVKGGPYLRKNSKAKILIPTGMMGPKFLVTQNFTSLLNYNKSLNYAVSVCVLANRINGKLGVIEKWPRDLQPLSRKDCYLLQSLLADKGYYKIEVDGVVGPATRQAVTQFQKNQNLIPDGFPCQNILKALKL